MMAHALLQLYTDVQIQMQQIMTLMQIQMMAHVTMIYMAVWMLQLQIIMQMQL